MKSFVINLGKNHEISTETSDVVRSGNVDASVKGYLLNTVTAQSNNEIVPVVCIDADALLPYFRDINNKVFTVRCDLATFEDRHEVRIYGYINPEQ